MATPTWKLRPSALAPGRSAAAAGSEEVVGAALREWSGERPYLFTKCGLHRDKRGTGAVTHSLKADDVRAKCEASLRRLGVEAIDLYQTAPGAGGRVEPAPL